MSDSVRPHRRQPTRLPLPWDSPGKNTGECCHFFLQGIFQTQESNPGLLHCRQIRYQLSHLLISMFKCTKIREQSCLLRKNTNIHQHESLEWLFYYSFSECTERFSSLTSICSNPEKKFMK